MSDEFEMTMDHLKDTADFNYVKAFADSQKKLHDLQKQCSTLREELKKVMDAERHEQARLIYDRDFWKSQCAGLVEALKEFMNDTGSHCCEDCPCGHWEDEAEESLSSHEKAVKER